MDGLIDENGGGPTVFASDISGADASFNNIYGEIKTPIQNFITKMDGLISIGSNGGPTVFASDILGADASFNNIKGTIVTSDETQPTMTKLTDIGTGGNTATFVSDVSIGNDLTVTNDLTGRSGNIGIGTNNQQKIRN